MAYLPDAFASKELCCLLLLAHLASFPPFHSYADLLEILLQYILMAFSLSNSFQTPSLHPDDHKDYRVIMIQKDYSQSASHVPQKS